MLAITLATALLTGVTSGALAVVVLYYQFQDWYRERYNLPIGEDGGGHEGFEFLMFGFALFSVIFVVMSLLSGILVWRRMKRRFDRN